MKLNERMRYPHPILSELSSDYISGKFSATFSQKVTEDDQLKIISELSTDCDELRDLVDNQKASVGYYVICRSTYFNHLQQVEFGKSEKYFEKSQFFGGVSLRPVIWTLEGINNYSSPLTDKEFGKDIVITKGAVLAIGPESRFSIDPEKFKPFETIFKLDKRNDIPPGMFMVDPEGDKIKIAAEPGTYSSIADMRKIPDGPTILLNSVYMPAVMDIIARLQTGDAGRLKSNRWYRVFEAKCDDMGINLSDNTSLPLEIAQKLLKSPFKGTIKYMQSIG
ncbi:MAG: hypothetical protein OXH01_06360 [Bacteroidetes bacterium]|nr:hypothetical protein [Bacteroidota bacterium]